MVGGLKYSCKQVLSSAREQPSRPQSAAKPHRRTMRKGLIAMQRVGGKGRRTIAGVLALQRP